MMSGSDPSNDVILKIRLKWGVTGWLGTAVGPRDKAMRQLSLATYISETG